MKKSIFILLIVVAPLYAIIAQGKFESLKFRSVGPLRGGRVTTVAGTVKEAGTFYLGATGGGVWKTTDYGTSWQNVSDGYFTTPSIGAISISQTNSDIVYAATGSDGLRSNVIKGHGVYKTVDAGKSWEHIGLKQVGQVGAIEINPVNEQIIYVAAIGQAFNANSERGIYKSINGGKSWNKVKFISDKTGFADIEIFQDNPDELLAAAWQAERKPWTIISGGNEGGIFKSKDGGSNWYRIENGLPSGVIGKIDLAVSPNQPNIVYALVEAEENERGLYVSEDRGESFKLISNKKELTSRPFYYTNVNVDPQNPQIVYVMATGYFKSVDGGKTWKTLRPPHGDNHDMWINPENTDLFIQANDGGANVTFNGGKTWSTQYNQPTAEIYQVELDDQYPYWLYGGQQDNYTTVSVPSMAPYGTQLPVTGWIINTGGCETGPAVPKPGNPDIVYANCKGRFSVFHKPSGTERKYDVGGANMYGQNPNQLKYRFQRVSPIHVSPHNSEVIYHTSQFVHRSTNEGKSWEIISPDLTAFEKNKQVISGAPLTRDITGEEFYSTIYSIKESSKSKGVIWVGANDGPVHVTADNGKNWKDVTPKDLMSGGRVDAVEPSPHQKNKAFISIHRYQLGDWKPYIYKTNDLGNSWELITNGIPSDFPVRVVREDPEREGLLYAGTEYGLYISFDDGANWESFQQNLPVTPVTDIKRHRGDLVLSTMGRGFWIMDNIHSLSGYKVDEMGNQLLPLKETVRYRFPKVRMEKNSHVQYPQPGLIIDYFLGSKPAKPIRLEILEETGNKVMSLISSQSKETKSETKENMSLSSITYLEEAKLTGKIGLNRYKWDFRHYGPLSSNTLTSGKSGPMIAPGNYLVRLIVDNEVLQESVKIVPDPRVIESGVTTQDMIVQERLALKVVEFMSELNVYKAMLVTEQKKLGKSTKDKKRLEKIEVVLRKLETEKGTYQEPKLIDQTRYLYFIISSADQLPGKDAIDRFNELQKMFVEIKTGFMSQKL